MGITCPHHLLCMLLWLLQKDKGFDSDIFNRQMGVMRGQVRATASVVWYNLLDCQIPAFS